MINYDGVIKENIKGNDPQWPQIIDNSQRILIMLRYVSRKTKTLLNLTKQQNDDDYNIIGKIHLFVIKMKD